MNRIRILAGGISLIARLDESATAREVWAALPFEAEADTWGNEIYFGIPVDIDLEPEARTEVETGEIGYWPPGRAFCIFFGPTPVSPGDEPVAASPVNVFGRVSGDATALRAVRVGENVRIERCGGETRPDETRTG